jgi:hypothetical protein
VYREVSGEILALYANKSTNAERRLRLARLWEISNRIQIHLTLEVGIILVRKVSCWCRGRAKR